MRQSGKWSRERYSERYSVRKDDYYRKGKNLGEINFTARYDRIFGINEESDTFELCFSVIISQPCTEKQLTIIRDNVVAMARRHFRSIGLDVNIPLNGIRRNKIVLWRGYDNAGVDLAKINGSIQFIKALYQYLTQLSRGVTL